jgi:hypothetical protein
MYIDINLTPVDFQGQYKCGMPAVKHHIMISLAYRMTYQLILYYSLIHEKILHVGLAAVKSG